MKTAYVARSVIPSQSANSIHVMKICEAFASLCDEFELIVPECEVTEENQDIYGYYGVNERFPINRVKRDPNMKGAYTYYFAFHAMQIILRKKFDKVITRDPVVAFLCVLAHKKVVLDLHGELAHQCGRAYRMIKWNFFKKSKYLKLVMITESLVKYYEKKYALEPELTVVLPDGCTLENFEPYQDQPLLQEEHMRIAYAGSFGTGRGYEIIQKLAENDEKNQYFIYGGTAEDAEKVTGKKPPENIQFKGFVPNREIPKELCSHDVLLLPYQNLLIAKGEDTGKVMSPLKLFEYMASGRVIVASDLNVLKEILTSDNSYFAVPEDADDWMKVLMDIDQNRENARTKAQQAKKDVRQYTWKIRAEKMLALHE